MTRGLQRRLEQAVERFEEIERLLAEPELADDPRRFTALSREYSELQGIVATWREIERLDEREAEAREMLAENDADMRKMANEELAELEAAREGLDRRLQRLIVPPDPNDRKERAAAAMDEPTDPGRPAPKFPPGSSQPVAETTSEYVKAQDAT